MTDPLQPSDFDNMSDDELAARLGKPIRDAEEWDLNNPDPQR